MGVFAETTINIECNNLKSAKEVLKVIKDKLKEIDEKNSPEEYFWVNQLGVSGDKEWGTVDGNMSSGRVQNLSYQTELLWGLIKDIKGVKEMYCPFMVEGEGESYYNEEE